MFCPLGAMKLGVEQKKLLHLIQPSQDPTHIYFFFSQGSRVSVEMGTKNEIWYGDFYVWGIDAFKFLWRLGARTKLIGVSN